RPLPSMPGLLCMSRRYTARTATILPRPAIRRSPRRSVRPLPSTSAKRAACPRPRASSRGFRMERGDRLFRVLAKQRCVLPRVARRPACLRQGGLLVDCFLGPGAVAFLLLHVARADRLLGGLRCPRIGVWHERPGQDAVRLGKSWAFPAVCLRGQRSPFAFLGAPRLSAGRLGKRAGPRP